jgi:hypothetical protein
VVVDGGSVAGFIHLTPVGLTGLNVYLPQTHPEVKLGISNGEGPGFKNPPPPLPTQLQQAYRLGQGHTVFLVTLVSDPSVPPEAASVLSQQDVPAQRAQALARYVELLGGPGLVFSGGGLVLEKLPPRFHVEGVIQTFPGVTPLALIEITDRGAP